MALKDPETKHVDPEQLREFETSELEAELARLKEARFRLKFRSATEAIDNPAQFMIMRRNISRIMTILREKAQS